MIIGLDFDNTIACYDQVFFNVALERGLIKSDIPRDKVSVRNYLRSLGNEEAWVALQGHVYGKAMDRVRPYEGVIDFLKWSKSKRHRCLIISHKTKYPYSGPKYDLHAAARSWIEDFLVADQDPLIKSELISFHNTKEEKINEIRESECSVFVDDLPEIFSAEQFPDHVSRVLFDPSLHHSSTGTWKSITHWNQLKNLIR